MKSTYNEIDTIAMQWANNPGTQQDDTKSIFDGKRNSWAIAITDKDADGGYRLIYSGSYKQVKEYERIHEKANDGFDRYVETYQSNKRRYTGSLWESRSREGGGRNSGYVDKKQRATEGDIGATNDEYVRSDIDGKSKLSDITRNEAEKLHTDFTNLLADSKLVTKSKNTQNLSKAFMRIYSKKLLVISIMRGQRKQKKVSAKC